MFWKSKPPIQPALLLFVGDKPYFTVCQDVNRIEKLLSDRHGRGEQIHLAVIADNRPNETVQIWAKPRGQVQQALLENGYSVQYSLKEYARALTGWLQPDGVYSAVETVAAMPPVGWQGWVTVTNMHVSKPSSLVLLR